MYLLNWHCSITDYPFGSECDKQWWYYDWENLKILRNDDQSITLECKDKGNSEQIISSIFIKLVQLKF